MQANIVVVFKYQHAKPLIRNPHFYSVLRVFDMTFFFYQFSYICASNFLDKDKKNAEFKGYYQGIHHHFSDSVSYSAII